VNMLAFMLRLFRLPVGRLPRPDTIVVSSPSLFPFLPAERLACRFDARLLLEVRDIWPLSLEELTGMPHRHPLLTAMRWVERRAYRTADAIVSVLPNGADHLVANGAREGTITVIPNGVALEPTVGGAAAVPARVAEIARQHAFNLGFVGTLGLANAIDALIAAADRLKDEDIGFLIVGHGPAASELEALAAHLPNVTFLGAVPKADVPATLGAFDVCYVGYHRSPLYRFGISPNKVFDYMSAARPVVLAAEAANDPVSDGGCGVTVPPDDPAALAEAILRIRAMSAPERERLGSSGRAFVEREHSYASLAGKYAAVLDAAC
jgi:glycosyltransferase involved in cell wall biosynthesis